MQKSGHGVEVALLIDFQPQRVQTKESKRVPGGKVAAVTLIGDLFNAAGVRRRGTSWRQAQPYSCTAARRHSAQTGDRQASIIYEGIERIEGI
jgi:hypothetical protein